MTTSEATVTGSLAGAGGVDGFAAAFAVVGAGLDQLGDLGAWSLTEDAVQSRLGEVLVLRARLGEVTARLVASVTDRELPRLGGVASTQSWLMGTHRMSVQDAARLVRESALHTAASADPGAGSGVARVAPTVAAWAGGVVWAEQAVLIGSTIDRFGGDVAAAAVDQVQGDLVGHAQVLSWRQLVTVCRHAGEVVDPDGADRRLAGQLDAAERRALAQCELTFRRSGDGWTGFKGRLPDVQADLWRKALEAIGSPRREPPDPAQPPLPLPLPLSLAGWDQAGPGCPRHQPPTGPDPAAETAAEASRTGDPAAGVDGADRALIPYPQRLGRAMCELLEHLPVDRLPRHGGTAVSLVVSTTLDQLRTGFGEAVLDTDTAISPGQVRRLACNAAIIPLVLDGRSHILDLGLAKRLFDTNQRLALAIRDHGCIWPSCDRPAAWCEAHHLTSWADGGPTDLTNGCLLCCFHHHLVHSRDGWHIQMAPDGIPEVIPPRRLDPTQTPRRHERLPPRRC